MEIIALDYPQIKKQSTYSNHINRFYDGKWREREFQAGIVWFSLPGYAILGWYRSVENIGEEDPAVSSSVFYSILPIKQIIITHQLATQWGIQWGMSNFRVQPHDWWWFLQCLLRTKSTFPSRALQELSLSILWITNFPTVRAAHFQVVFVPQGWIPPKLVATPATQTSLTLGICAHPLVHLRGANIFEPMDDGGKLLMLLSHNYLGAFRIRLWITPLEFFASPLDVGHLHCWCVHLGAVDPPGEISHGT